MDVLNMLRKISLSIPTDIDKLKVEKPKIEYWTKEEIDFFLNEIKGTYLYTPILIAVLTGLRVGELCGLKWSDIDLENGYITVNNQVIHDKSTKQLLLTSILKTSTSYRQVSIPNILINHLESLKTTNNDFVLKDRNGSMCNPRNISVEFTKKISQYENLRRITFHSLRHTHATLLIFNGENIKVVSERLGHKDISVTLNTYTHVMDDIKKDTAKLLDIIFEQKMS